MPNSNKVTVSEALIQDIALRGLEIPSSNIPEEGREYTYQADEAELKRLSQVIGLGMFRSLHVTYTVLPFKKNMVRMTSTMMAEIDQICGVSLEPLNSNFNDEAVTIFVPERKLDDMLELDDANIISDENFESIVDRRLEVGRVLYEQLVSGLDPYPRAQGVEYDPETGGDGEIDQVQESPFAVLAELKKAPKN